MSAPIDISSSPVPEVMPNEKAFLDQASLVREALKTFLVVRDLDAPSVIRLSLNDLVKHTVSFASPSHQPVLLTCL
jgi:hypothetical protein